MHTQERRNSAKRQYSDVKSNGLQKKSGPRQRLRRELANLSYEDQVQMLRPTKLIALGQPRPNDRTQTSGSDSRPSTASSVQLKLASEPVSAHSQDDAVVRKQAAEGLAGATAKVPYQREMETAFGQSFEGVRAHVGTPPIAQN